MDISYSKTKECEAQTARPGPSSSILDELGRPGRFIWAGIVYTLWPKTIAIRISLRWIKTNPTNLIVYGSSSQVWCFILSTDLAQPKML